MSSPDDEFDLDVRFLGVSGTGASYGGGPEMFHPGLFASPETVAPEATCPAHTCGMDCITDTCPNATCGCNTSETCENPMCGSDAITFGRYCEDQTDESCGCGGGGTGAGCVDDDPPQTSAAQCRDPNP